MDNLDFPKSPFKETRDKYSEKGTNRDGHLASRSMQDFVYVFLTLLS
jgi:hypothetical protein